MTCYVLRRDNDIIYAISDSVEYLLTGPTRGEKRGLCFRPYTTWFICAHEDENFESNGHGTLLLLKRQSDDNWRLASDPECWEEEHLHQIHQFWLELELDDGRKLKEVYQH